MHASLRTALLLLASATITAGACGGNVVVDGSSTGTGLGGATTTTTTTGLGAGPVTTNDATVTSAVATTTAAGTGGAPTDACSDSTDQKVLITQTIFPDVE